MPTYDYACAACGHRFEVIHGVHASGPEACPNCGHSPVRKAVSAPSVVFKGSGWAKLDRRTSAAAAKPKPGSEDAAKPAAKGDDGGTAGGSGPGDASGSTTTSSDSAKPSSAASGSVAAGGD